MYASRNIALCTKDCLCLFVCPTGATDTENGQIDKSKCVEGCRACVDACPSHAIHLVMERYPVRAPTDRAVAEALLDIAEQKTDAQRTAEGIAASDQAPGLTRLSRALARSCRILAEDCAREAGYLIPESRATGELLAGIASEGDDEARARAQSLLDQT